MARQQAAHRSHPHRPPAHRPAGFLLSVPLRERAGGAHQAVAGVRHRLGVALIRAGLRMADPARQIRRI